MGIEAQGKIVEQVDLDDKKEDKASNEVVEAVKKVAMEGVDKEKEQVGIRSPTLNALMILLTTSSCNVKDADDESNNDDDNADHHIVIFHQLYFWILQSVKIIAAAHPSFSIFALALHLMFLQLNTNKNPISVINVCRQFLVWGNFLKLER